MRVQAVWLQKTAEDILVQYGAPDEYARIQAELLLEAELRGIPSHGLQRLPLILSRMTKGLIQPAKSGSGQWMRQAFLAVDGERGFGPVVMLEAMGAMKSAVACSGLAIAAISNSNHIGMLAYYAEAAAKSGLIGIITSTSEALVHPYGGTQAMLGTNPIAIGIPTGEEPFVLDLATSIVSMGRVNHHALRNAPIPLGWAVDADGNSTTNAQAAREGALAPFGGAKGYGLGLAFEFLVATLAGSSFAPQVRGTLDDANPANKGDLIILIDPKAGAGKTAYLREYLEQLRSSRSDDPAHPVAIPGEGSRARRTEMLAAGIEIPQRLMDTLKTLIAA